MGQRYNHISFDERARIALLHEAGQSLRKIAAALDRPPSTVSRELKRNSGNQVGYKPSWADDQAWSRRWRGSKLERQPAMRNCVLEHLAKGQSPEQIAGRLTLEQSSFRISHESIYRFIYAQIARTKTTNGVIISSSTSFLIAITGSFRLIHYGTTHKIPDTPGPDTSASGRAALQYQVSTAHRHKLFFLKLLPSRCTKFHMLR